MSTALIEWRQFHPSILLAMFALLSLRFLLILNDERNKFNNLMMTMMMKRRRSTNICRRMSTVTSARGSSRASTEAPAVRRSSRLDGPLSSACSGLRHSSTSHRPSIISQRLDHPSRQIFYKLENTYRMGPDDKHRFQPGVVENMLGIWVPTVSDLIVMP